jgi:hypothetical protein
MANLSNINNKLVLTTDGAALINQGTVDYGTAKLQVSGNGSTGTITWRNDGGRKTGYLYSDSNGIAIYSTALNNAGIYLADNLRIDFRVNGSERMRIDSSGVISIGPSTTSSEIYFNYNNTNNKGGLKIDYSTGELRLTAGESGNGYHQAFYTNGAERMRIDSSGKILLNNSSYNFIGTNTSDGSNTQRIYIGAGNDATATQGGLVSVYGNETSSASEQGQVSLIAGRKSTGNIRFWTGEATTIERMTILSGGNVGIGTPTPNYKLSVANASTRIISATYIDSANGIMSHAGAPNYGLESFQVRGDFISFWTDYDASHYQGTEKMRIDQSGNVLIGTTSIENPRGLAQALEIEAGSPVGIILNDSRDTYPMGIENAGAVMNFTYNTSPLMTILAGGNVGIGVTGPQTKLEVVGETLINSLGLKANRLNSGYNVAGDNADIWINYEGYLNNNLYYRNFNIGDGRNGTVATFNGSTKIAYFQGFVGIGNTNPHAPLSIYRPDNTYGSSIAIQNNISGTGSSQGFYLGISTGTIGYVWNYENDDLVFATNNLERMRITSGGNIDINSHTGASIGYGVRIAKQSGYSQLYMEADTTSTRIIQRFYNPTGNVGNISIVAYNTTYSTSSSDERLKKNITNWDENILDKFKDIKPKEFNFNNQDNSEEKIKGYIAQNEVDKFPEAYPLLYNEEVGEDRHMFNPSGMVVYLMKAIQELKADNDSLKARIETLENN